MSTIKEVISQKNWHFFISNYSVDDVCMSLNFKEAMHLARHLFYDDYQDDANQQFALKLVFKIKNYFKHEWEKDWKNDIFLGHLCQTLWLYEEQYICYKSAYDKLTDPPAALLLLLARCTSMPGIPLLTEEESESYLRRSIEKKITYESALLMRTLYRRKGDKSQEKYWDQMYRKLGEENVFSDELVAEVFKQ